MGFPLGQKWVTLNDLERRNGHYFVSIFLYSCVYVHCTTAHPPSEKPGYALAAPLKKRDTYTRSITQRNYVTDRWPSESS